MKGFYKKRPLSEEEKEKYGELAGHLQGALPAISLTGHPALSTAFLNDVDPEWFLPSRCMDMAGKAMC